MPIIPTLSLKLWAYIGTGLLIAALFTALLITRTTLAETKRDRDEAQLKLSVSNASIRTMQGEVKRMVAEQKALANSDLNRINASRQKLQYIDAVANVRQAAINNLNASALAMRPADPEGQCNVSAAFMENWAS